MISDPDLDRILTAWLAEGAERAPAQDRAAALRQVDRTRQRHRLLGGRGAGSTLSSNWSVAAALVVVVAAAVTGVAGGRSIETIGRSNGVGAGGSDVTFEAAARIPAQWFNNDDEVFSAVVPAVPKDEPLYWRAVTFNQFVLGAWINSPGTTQDVDAGAPLLDGTEEAPDPDLTHTIKVTVRPDNFSDNKLLTPGLPTDVSAGAVVNLTGPDGWFQGADVQGDPSEYTVDAQVMREGDTAVISGNRLAAASTAYPTDVAALYTDVPQGAMGPEADKLLATIEQMAGGSTNPYVLASTMEKYLSTGPFHYSTDLTNLPCTDPSAVECFAATKTGYCLHFASTMAILLRAANPENRIPTRLVEGFLPSDPVGGVVTITARAAHAWVEVYFPGYGWIRFDPTGGNIGTKPSEIKPGPSVGAP